ncbi:MAG: thermonuclease family protein [Candidatus Omnitrophica bacterium]|nr:thermonuclease family protein [Candidatus Omnitrophota bacterium]
MTIPATQNAYRSLLKKVAREITTGKLVIEYLQALTYWKVGRHIATHLLNHNHRAGYGEQLYKKLAEDTEIHARNLQQSVRFYREFPIPSGRSELTWTHYRALLTVKDKEKRGSLLKKIRKEHLNSTQLENIIHRKYRERKSESQKNKIKAITTARPAVALRFRRGRLFTYKVLAIENEGVLLDCGFNVWRRLVSAKQAGVKVGDWVAAREVNGAARLSPSALKPAQRYTYAARLEKVVDGDTVWARIDCGFNIIVRQKLRLRGIDTPEINTSKGKLAKQFITRALKGCHPLVIKTHGTDKYARYLVDIFYLPNQPDANVVAAQGVFLNQQLLDEGLAGRYER